ncbi:hypothetical protein MN116_000593 [Schistosoma mekongi]|uniref:Uncharacterized protein n=1 Tax=Schistosoma mekongi TaxID=38744 RepID=A0AAE1ZIW3_SCHME|nr:hypothetical protein MN116_000593 [Schistosoma mekongi]
MRMHLKLTIRFLITVLLALSISFTIIWKFQKLINSDVPRILTFHSRFGNFKSTSIKPFGYECISHNIDALSTQFGNYNRVQYQSNPSANCKNSIVVLTLSKSSPTSRYLINIIKALLISHHVISVNHVQLSNISNLLRSISQNERIRIVIFENFAIYTNLPPPEKLNVNIFLKNYNIGVIGFLFDGETFTTEGGTWSKPNYKLSPLHIYALSTYILHLIALIIMSKYEAIRR